MQARTHAHGRARPDAGAVLAKATLRAAEILGLSDALLARILGVSGASVSRLRSGRAIAPGGKEWELAVLFVRLYRDLDALLGGDAGACGRWLRAGNDHLGGVPLDLVQTVPGLVNATQYLDALRGKN
jgi:hypothetical protein